MALIEGKVFADGTSGQLWLVALTHFLANVPAIFGHQLLAARKQPATPAASPPAIPPVTVALFVAGLVGLSGCAGWSPRKVTYATLTGITEGTTVTMQKLPSACEAAELAAAKDQTTKEGKISESGKVHAHCEGTAKALTATHDGLIAARNFAASAPDDSKQWPKWVWTAIQLYEDVRPLVRKYGIEMPEVTP
jgi:hypothetical protein